MNNTLPINSFRTTEIYHLRPSRSIEVIFLENQGKFKCLYLYNHEGNHFRLFDSLIELIQFFEADLEAEYSFFTEDALDKYLEDFPIGY
jgi:hypothetical protein